MQYDFLENDLLIVCPNSYKEAILKYLSNNKKMYSIKFMTMNEYKKNYFFDYDINTIHYLVKKQMKVENALNILDNLYYIENKEYLNSKLDYLVSIKKELDENNLLIYNPLFKKILDRKKIIVYGYGKLDSFSQQMFSSSKVIFYPKLNDKYIVYKFDDIQEEVEFVFQQVANLLKKGININKISLMNLDSEYLPIIKRIESFYSIFVDIENNDTLMGTILGQNFYNLILDGKKNDEIINRLKKFDNQKDYSFIIDLLNKYSGYILYDVKEEIKYELLNQKIKKDVLENVLKVKKVFDYVNDDEYVFLLNFNNSSIPSLKMDTDYITNNIKEKVGLMKVEDENTLIKENTIDYLGSIKNLVISYKEKTPFNTYYPSSLLEMMNYEIREYNRSFYYSKEANKSLYTKYLDDYVKFGIKNKNIDMLYSNYGDNDYFAYHNQFTNINKDNLMKYLDNQLTLSYSSIDNFYKCAFRYYLCNILKIDLFEESFMTIIGNLFHYCLSHMNDDNFDLNREYNDFLKEKTFNNKEKFFLEKLKNDLSFIIETVKKHQFISGFTNMLYEKKIDIKLKESPYVHFKGFIDKIMYKEKNGEALVSIIDYKTGSPDIKIKNLNFGLSMQLPIYLYLVNNSGLLSNIKFVGFYLMHILNVDIKKNSKKSVLEQKEDNLKLLGYSTNNLERLSAFDATYENSEMIRGMKIKKDGNLASSAKVLSDDEVRTILNITHEKIMEAVNEILEGRFIINPKIINGKNVSCEYCSFKDICYHDEKNNVYIKSEEGDEDASMDEGTE